MGLDNYRRNLSETKRASILKAGLEIFLRDGYSRAAVVDIARAADVSTATLYKHFASKEELFAAVVREAAQDQQNYGELVTSGASIEEVAMALAQAYLSMQFERRFNSLTRIVIAEASSCPKLSREMAEFIVDRRINNLKAAIDTLVERGLLVPHDTLLGARLASGMIKELFVWPALFDANYRLPPDADRKVHAAMEIYLARYGVHSREGRTPD